MNMYFMYVVVQYIESDPKKIQLCLVLVPHSIRGDSTQASEVNTSWFPGGSILSGRMKKFICPE